LRRPDRRGERYRQGPGRGRVAGAGGRAPGGATISGAEGLVGDEGRDRIRLGGIEDGRLVEVEERIGVVGRLVGRRGAGAGSGGGEAGKPM
jgi:hypothetical protein